MFRSVTILVTLLLSFSCSVFASNHQVFTHSLIDVVDSGNEDDLLARISQDSELDVRDDLGITPLIKAASNDNANLFRILLLNGADPTLTDVGGIAPIHIAARNGNIAILKMCIDSGVNVDARDLEGWTPLMHATANERMDVVKTLISANADIKIVDYNDNMVMIYAVMSNNAEILRMILHGMQAFGDKQREKIMLYARSNRMRSLLSMASLGNLLPDSVPNNKDTTILGMAKIGHAMQYQNVQQKTDSLQYDAGASNNQSLSQWRYMLYLGSFPNTADAYKYWKEHIRDIVSFEEGKRGLILPAVVRSKRDVTRLYIGFFAQKALADHLHSLIVDEYHKPCRVLKSTLH